MRHAWTILGLSSVALAFVWWGLVFPLGLKPIYGDLFWISNLSLVLCTGVVALLYATRGGSGRQARFVLGWILAALAAVTYGGFEAVGWDFDKQMPNFREAERSVLVVTRILIDTAKNLISFGFAAFGVSVAANAVTEVRSVVGTPGHAAI